MGNVARANRNAFVDKTSFLINRQHLLDQQTAPPGLFALLAHEIAPHGLFALPGYSRSSTAFSRHHKNTVWDDVLEVSL